MKTRKPIEYSLAAMVHIARNEDAGATDSYDISETYGLPHGFLLKVLIRLVKAGLLYSKRGKNGGYYLARSPEQITLLDIIEATVGPMNRHEIDTIDGPDSLYLSRLEKIVNKAIEAERAVYDSSSLKDIISDMDDEEEKT